MAASALLAQLVEHLHGKEGVDGSSPSEGSAGPRKSMKTSKTLSRSATRVALGVAFALSVPLVAMLITDDVVWSLADFVAAGVFLAAIGVVLELAVRRAGNLVAAFGIAAVGVAAGIVGEADDSPGLVLLGILLIVSACALGLRTAQRSR